MSVFLIHLRDQWRCELQGLDKQFLNDEKNFLRPILPQFDVNLISILFCTRDDLEAGGEPEGSRGLVC